MLPDAHRGGRSFNASNIVLRIRIQDRPINHAGDISGIDLANLANRVQTVGESDRPPVAGHVSGV